MVVSLGPHSVFWWAAGVATCTLVSFPWALLWLMWLVVGLLLGLAEKKGVLSATASAVLVTGFCGGFTTFSTFADDMFLMLQKGHIGLFALYVTLSLLLGIGLVCVGRYLVR